MIVHSAMDRELFRRTRGAVSRECPVLIVTAVELGTRRLVRPLAANPSVEGYKVTWKTKGRPRSAVRWRRGGGEREP